MDLLDCLQHRRLDETFPLPADAPFTFAAARESGVSRRQLRDLVEHGLLRRPLRGVYVAAALRDDVALRAACLALVVPPDCVVVDRHAGWLLGAEMVLAPGEHLDLRPLSLFRPSGHGRLRNGLADSGERNLTRADVTEVHGLAVTTPIRTAWDLGRVRWTDEAITGLDAMLRTGAFTREELLAGVERFRGMRWVRTLRAVAPHADGRSESPGESVLRLRCIDNGVLTMRPQVEVWDCGRFVARLDLGDEDLAGGFEYDGDEWHTSPEQRAHDRDRRTATADAGWLVEPFVAADVFGPRRTCDRRIVELVQRARARRGLSRWI